MNMVQKLRQLTEEIRAAATPAKAAAAWELAGRLLGRTPADQAAAARACADRDLDALDEIVHRLEHPPEVAATVAPPVDEEELTRALKAFRKRLKLARLSDESKLGGRHTTSGRQSRIDAIQPPNDFEPHVWRALAAAGRLRDAGQGFYAEP